MILRAKHDNRLYTYDENIWTGRKELRINGAPLKKISKNTFQDPDTHEPLILKGSLLIGVKIVGKEKTIVLHKNSALDWILIYLPLFVAIMIMMLSGATRAGAIQGGLCGALAGGGGILVSYYNASILMQDKKQSEKILITIATTIATGLALFFIYSLM